MNSGTTIDIEALKRQVRDVPDFPTPGILFRDITPLLANGTSLQIVIDAMAEPYVGTTTVVAIESRGFILGAAVAYKLGAGLALVRKAGKLPAATIREEYKLEYGTNTVELHRDAVQPGERVLIVDDLLATGGTVRAAISLVEKLGASVTGISVLAELSDLHGRERLQGYEVRSLIVY